jgi:hypothetical protein
VQPVHRPHPATAGQGLQLELQVGGGGRVEQLAQLFRAQQLGQQLAVEGEGLRPALERGFDYWERALFQPDGEVESDTFNMSGGVAGTSSGTLTYSAGPGQRSLTLNSTFGNWSANVTPLE